jgi:hypothetical protein
MMKPKEKSLYSFINHIHFLQSNFWVHDLCRVLLRYLLMENTVCSRPMILSNCRNWSIVFIFTAWGISPSSHPSLVSIVRVSWVTIGQCYYMLQNYSAHFFFIAKYTLNDKAWVSSWWSIFMCILMLGNCINYFYNIALLSLVLHSAERLNLIAFPYYQNYMTLN